MNLKLYCECQFLKDKEFYIQDTFSVFQKELLFNNIVNESKFSFIKKDVEYKCRWEKQNSWSAGKPTVIMPIRNNVFLLKKTLSNLIENGIDEICNIIVVDDRSTENIQAVVLKNSFSYLRVDNEKGFNFSMLNNIAAKLCSILGSKEIILWNSDLWCVKRDYFIRLLERHREYKSKISGTKLLYPPLEQSLHKEIDTKNIDLNFPHMKDAKWRNTVQFAGPQWVHTNGVIKISPIHFRRFSHFDDPRVNCDRGCSFLTGALQVWNLNYFLEIGGLNPSLSKNFQDVDICLRAIENGDIPFYFGKDIYFYHDESYNFNNNEGEIKNDLQMRSDHCLFAKLWNEKISAMVF